MSGSKFVGGILSCGVEVELSKSIMALSNSFINEMQLVGEEQKCASGLAKSTSDFINTAENEIANASEATAGSYLGAGLADVSGAAISIGTRVKRESPTLSSDLREINSEGKNIQDWKNTLHNGDSEIMSGKIEDETRSLGAPGKDIEMTELKSKPKSTAAIKDEGLDKLRQKTYAKTNPLDDNENSKVSKLKALRSAENKGEQGRDMINKGKLYDDIEEKLKDEEKANQNKRQSYESKTDRIVNYVQSASQAASHFSQAAGNYNAAKAQRRQADADSMKQMEEFATQSQKTAADTSSQTAQNSAQGVTELTRAKSEIAQANKM